MIFWRILDNKLYSVKETDALGFEESEGLRIPDEYLNNKEFIVMRTCHGLGDWGIISVMPRLLKEKYPDCKVYLPSPKLLENLFSQHQNNWSIWNNPFINVKYVFDNNPYIDGYKDEIDGEVFHDHYRIYNKNNVDIPIVEQMLKFWQFDKNEYQDSQPELYWSDDERELGDSIIKEHVGNIDFGALLISNRFGTQYSKYDEKSYKNDFKKTTKLLKDNQLPYFYWCHKPLDELGFDFIDKALDMRHMNLRIQLYIKSKAKLNISNQCGANHLVARYSKCYEIQRQFPIGMNFVRGEIYI